MSDNIAQSEAKLQKLAKHLHLGWAKLHPATEKDLAAGREVVRLQWEQERQIEKRIAAFTPARITKTRPKAKSLNKPSPNRPPSQDHYRGR